MGCRILACLRRSYCSLHISSKTFRRAYACRSRGSGEPGISHENVSYSFQRTIFMRDIVHLLLAPAPRYTDTKAGVRSNVS
jgi:hypothetical protein